ncbi:MAG TPA: DUF1365 domain-containing protein [Solirubrobacteraceae bacterium]|nr:DUF1365 domain-containing protein [Solirubrobacteraceae bacterium]
MKPHAGARVSCLYYGSVRHRHHGTPSDELRYRLFMVYLDLDELPRCLDGRLLWSARHPAVAWFRRADHLGDPRTPLAGAVRELVAERTGRRPDGPIRLLTHLRYFGHCFNPVSFYYCYDADRGEAGGERLSAVIAHVTNTPWGERHSYVMPVCEAADHGSTTLVSGSSRKQLHVSPLMSMDHTYEWRVSEPGHSLSVHIESHRDGSHSTESVFDATLALRRRELSGRELARALARYPLLTLRISARIYGHALRLRLRGASYFPHPRTAATDDPAVPT